MNEFKTIVLSDGIKVIRKKFTLNINPNRRYRIEFPCGSAFSIVDNLLYCEIANFIKWYRSEGMIMG